MTNYSRSEVLNELTQATQNWLDKANQIFNKSFQLPKISIDLRGRVAGYAIRSYSGNEVKFNAELYVQNKEDFINRTVPHELAHLIANALYPYQIKSHGREWKQVMNRLGLEAKRCHSYDTSTVSSGHARPYVYACKCKEHKITKLLHSKMSMGQTRTCRTCRVAIKFIRMEVAI